MDIPDTIERRLELPQPVERVWSALTEPAEVGAWFGEDVTLLELRPGGRMVQHFRDPSRPELGLITSEHVITEVDPPHRLAWAWKPWPEPGEEDLPVLEGPHTVVTWTLEPSVTGTVLTMVESGFASLPAERGAQAQKENQGGWDHELGELAEYLAA
jgi:uncharacterized protein YndB with AHSA1/START domain